MTVTNGSETHIGLKMLTFFILQQNDIFSFFSPFIYSILNPVPDAPQHLHLYLNKNVPFTITGCWSPPANTHGLIREYVVSDCIRTEIVRRARLSLNFKGAEKRRAQ